MREHPRDEDAERRERLRYRVLEQLYLLTGADCTAVIYDWQIEEELDLPVSDVEAVAADLEQLGFLQRTGDGARYCITKAGIHYLSQGAWRRRSIRD